MSALLIVNGLRFFFYSNENSEPPHVHVTKGEASGKIWLEPDISVAYLYKFTNSEEKLIMETVISHVEEFKKKWNEYFDK